MAKPFNMSSREAWGNIGKTKASGSLRAPNNVRAAKGMGPNKACGHKGGICRQGSKR